MEGTPAYCPLEVLTKTSPLNQLSDSWALGCLTLFCLEGRPRFFGDIDEVINQIRRDFQLVHTSDIVMSQDNKVTFTENGSGIWSDLSSLKNDDAISRRAISFLKSLLAIGKQPPFWCIDDFNQFIIGISSTKFTFLLVLIYIVIFRS